MTKNSSWWSDGNLGVGGDSVGPYKLAARPDGRFGFCKMCAAKVKEGKMKRLIKKKLWWDPVFKAHWCQGCLREIYKGASIRNKEQKKRFGKFLNRMRARRARG